MAEAAEVQPDTGDTLDADLDAQREAEGPETEAGGEAGGEAVAAEVDPKPAPDPERLRAENRSVKTALREERKNRQALEERLSKLESGGQTNAQKVAGYLEGLPDPDQDPIGAIHHFKAVLERLENENAEEVRAQETQRAQQQAVAQVVTTMQEYEADFRAEHDDYDAAVEHFKKARAEEFAATGLTGAALQNELARDFLGIVHRCASANRDPAEVVYNLAKRAGFTLKPVDAPNERLQQIAKGQQQARSLGAGAGRESGPMSLEAINKLKGAAFDEASSKFIAEGKRQDRRLG